MDFTFESSGPNGKIIKAVMYTPREIDGILYYNLGFGDLNPETGKIDDLSISNNDDRHKILSTVAATVLEFTTYFPNALIYAEGSTSSRTRLYQMGLSANINYIKRNLDIYGLAKGHWHIFEKNVNYEAFMALRK